MYKLVKANNDKKFVDLSLGMEFFGYSTCNIVGHRVQGKVQANPQTDLTCARCAKYTKHGASRKHHKAVHDSVLEKGFVAAAFILGLPVCLTNKVCIPVVQQNKQQIYDRNSHLVLFL